MLLSGYNGFVYSIICFHFELFHVSALDQTNCIAFPNNEICKHFILHRY